MEKRFFYFYILFLILFSTLHAYKIELYHTQPHLDRQLMSIMKNEFNIQALVETGTWNGQTALTASEIFSRVYTVEIHFPTFKNTSRILKRKNNIFAYYGKSSNFLNKMLKRFPTNTLFWLDAHYSGEGTGTIYVNENCIKSPLKDELTITLSNFDPSWIVLIDDIRGYHNVSEEKKLGREYATVYELFSLTKNRKHPLNFHVLGDMVLIYDPSYYQNIEVSPFVESCTASYIFNPFISPTQQDIENVIRAECFLINDEGTQTIDDILQSLYQNYALPVDDGGGFYPTLWQGLRLMQKHNYAEALRRFESLYVVAPHICHQRFNLYMAKCHQEIGNTDKAKELLTSIDDSTKNCMYLVFKPL